MPVLAWIGFDRSSGDGSPRMIVLSDKAYSCLSLEGAR